MAKIYTSSVLKKGATDSWAALMAKVEKAKDRDTIVLPDGTFNFSKPIETLNKSLHFEANGATIFKCLEGGFFINRTQTTRTTVIADLRLEGSFVGSGVKSRSRVRLDGVVAFRFMDGFEISGNIKKDGSNANRCIINDCTAQQNAGNGFYFDGPDANGSSVYSCDIRDNGGAGVLDNSFLGNSFYSCMAHNNKGGHYHALNANNHAAFVNCYGEGDSPASTLYGHASFSGLHPSKIELYHSAISKDGKKYDAMEFDNIGFEPNKMKIGSFNVAPSTTDGQWGLDYLGAARESKLINFFGNKSKLAGDVDRYPTFAGVSFKHIVIGNRVMIYAPSVESLSEAANYREFEFTNGDQVMNPKYDGNNPRGWACIAPGKIGVAQWKPFN